MTHCWHGSCLNVTLNLPPSLPSPYPLNVHWRVHAWIVTGWLHHAIMHSVASCWVEPQTQISGKKYSFVSQTPSQPRTGKAWTEILWRCSQGTLNRDPWMPKHEACVSLELPPGFVWLCVFQDFLLCLVLEGLGWGGAQGARPHLTLSLLLVFFWGGVGVWKVSVVWAHLTSPNPSQTTFCSLFSFLVVCCFWHAITHGLCTMENKALSGECFAASRLLCDWSCFWVILLMSCCRSWCSLFILCFSLWCCYRCCCWLFVLFFCCDCCCGCLLCLICFYRSKLQLCCCSYWCSCCCWFNCCHFCGCCLRCWCRC